MPMPDMPGGEERELTAGEWVAVTALAIVGAVVSGLFWWPLVRYVFAYYFA